MVIWLGYVGILMDIDYWDMIFFLGWDILRYYGYEVNSYYVITITIIIYIGIKIWNGKPIIECFTESILLFHGVHCFGTVCNSICPSLLLSYRYFVCYYFDCCYLYLKFQLTCKKTTSRAFIRLHHPKYHQPAMSHGNRFLLGYMAHVCSRMLMKTLLW